MKKSKKTLAFTVLMILIVCFIFVGCKGDDKSTDKEREQNPTETVNETAPTGDAQTIPTDSPSPTDTTVPTITPVPTDSPPVETPTPELIATSTPTPEPTATSTPTPEPTATSTPTPEPTATSTPTPIPLKDVAIDGNNFPDSVFRKYVSDHFDTNRDGKLNEEEIKNATVIELEDDDVCDFTGIEYLVWLETLDCDHSGGLVVLDVRKNTNLKTIDCHDCRTIEQLYVGENDNLDNLWCKGNAIKSLDVSGCPNLTLLNCRKNELDFLNVSGCAKLDYLDCGTNLLTTIDISTCTALTSLLCGGNNLVSLDVSKCTKLIELGCAENSIASLNVDYCPELEKLTCNDNVLTSLKVTRCSKLTQIECSGNKLTSLDVSGCPKLGALWCNDNQIVSLDVTKCVDLTLLHCDNNNITSLDVGNCKKLLSASFEADPQVSLTGWILDGDTEGPIILSIGTYREDVVKELRKKYPSVEFVEVGSSDDYDVIYFGGSFDRLYQEGKLYCIDEAYKKYKEQLPENRCKYFTQNGRKYGVPMSMDNNVGCLFANMDLLKKAGYETIPETYDELVKCCDKLISLGIIPFGCAGCDGEEWCMCQVLETFIVNSCGAETFEKILSNRTSWNNQGIIDAADLLKQIVDKGYFNQDIFEIDFETVQRNFVNGRYAFFLSDATNCYVFDENHMNVKVSYFPVINVEKANKGELSGGNLNQGLGVSSRSRRPELAADVAFELGKLLSKNRYLEQNEIPVWPIDYDDSSKGNLTRETVRLVTTAHDYVAPEYWRLSKRLSKQRYYSNVSYLLKYSWEDGTEFASSMDYVIEAEEEGY